MAQHVHVEADRLLDHALADPARPDHGQRAAGDLVPEPGQVGVPGRPLARAHLDLGRVEPARDGPHHEEGVLGGGVGQDVGGVGERDPVAVGGRAVDVVDAHRDLGDDPETRGRAGREDLLVDRVPEGGDEGGDARADLLENERLRGRLDLRVDLHLEAPLAEAVERLAADVAGGVDPERCVHGSLSTPRGVPRITLPA